MQGLKISRVDRHEGLLEELVYVITAGLSPSPDAEADDDIVYDTFAPNAPQEPPVGHPQVGSESCWQEISHGALVASS